MVIKSFIYLSKPNYEKICNTYEGNIKFDISCKIRFSNDFIRGKWSSAIGFCCTKVKSNFVNRKYFIQTQCIYTIYIYICRPCADEGPIVAF